MKKPLLLGIVLLLAFASIWHLNSEKPDKIVEESAIVSKSEVAPKLPKKTPEQRALFAEERAKYEFKLQRNPNTGEIPKQEKISEFENAKRAKLRVEGGENERAADAAFISRGPTNLGGRTRAIVVDVSDGTGNTILAGGVSSGLFRTTNGGTSWTKVSANSEIHNVTCIAQDPTKETKAAPPAAAAAAEKETKKSSFFVGCFFGFEQSFERRRCGGW